jgi:hypothetical protein
MKTIDDTPKELHELFEKELAKWPMLPDIQTAHAFRLAVQHFFFLGFDVAMATGGMKPKRTIVEVKSNANGQWIVRSNDGKLFIHGVDRGGVPQWLPYPDLPQD